MKTIYLYDLDNTLVNSSHRQHLDDNGDLIVDQWVKDSIPELIKKDTINFPILEILKHTERRSDSLNICITSRVMQKADYDFLDSYDITFDKFLHRGSGMMLHLKSVANSLTDEQLKSVLLENYFRLNNHRAGWGFDDKPYILDVFKRFGFKTVLSDLLLNNDVDYRDVITEIKGI